MKVRNLDVSQVLWNVKHLQSIISIALFGMTAEACPIKGGMFKAARHQPTPLSQPSLQRQNCKS